jgi:hypothetical protein
VGFRFSQGVGLSSITAAAISAQLPGDTLVSVFAQYTEPPVFGPLPLPSISSAWSVLHTPADKQLSAWAYYNAPASTGVAITGLGASALQDLYLVCLRTPPAAALRGSNFKDSQAASLTLTSGNAIFTGDATTVLAWFAQFRSATGSAVQPAFTSPGSSFAIAQDLTRSQSDGGTGFYKLHDALLDRGPVAAGTYSTQVTATVSNVWSSGIVAIR